MPVRELPRTNSQRWGALHTVKTRLDGPLSDPPPLRDATIAWLNTFWPVYSALQTDIRVALAAQAAGTHGLTKLRKAARIWVGQGYASIVNATVRGTFTRSVLNTYGMPLDAKGAPNMKSEAGILAAARALQNGEAARVAAGGQPIAFPSVAEIMVHANAFRAANIQQGTLKAALTDAQKALNKANVEADRLILRLWNEIESAYDVGNPPSMRRKARDWGVVYVQGRKEAPTAETSSAMGHITDAATGKPLRKVSVRMEEPPVRTKSNGNGRYALPLLPPGTYTVRFMLKGHTDVEHTMEVTHGHMAVVDVQMTAKAAA